MHFQRTVWPCSYIINYRLYIQLVQLCKTKFERGQYKDFII